MATLEERLRVARESLSITQNDMAARLGMSVRGYQDNEQGKRTAKTKVIAEFQKLGIDANWLLTGEGPMRLGEQRSADPAIKDEVEIKTTVDEKLLTACLKVLEEVCQERKIRYEPEQKAEIIALLYELQAFEDAEHRQPEKAKVLKLVQFAGRR